MESGHVPSKPAYCETLDLDPDDRVVQILRTSYSTGDTPVHALETVCAATRHVFPIGQVAGADKF